MKNYIILSIFSIIILISCSTHKNWTKSKNKIDNSYFNIVYKNNINQKYKFNRNNIISINNISDYKSLKKIELNSNIFKSKISIILEYFKYLDISELSNYKFYNLGVCTLSKNYDTIFLLCEENNNFDYFIYLLNVDHNDNILSYIILKAKYNKRKINYSINENSEFKILVKNELNDVKSNSNEFVVKINENGYIMNCR